MTSGRSSPALEVADAHREDLGTGHVDRVGEPPVAGAHVERAELEVLVALGQRVRVDQDLLVGVVIAVGTPAEGRVLLALLGAGHVPPRPPACGHGQVGLEDAALDLLEELFLQGSEGREPCVGERVLSLEVGGRVGVVTVAEPGVLVDDLVAVANARHRDPLRDRGLRHPSNLAASCSGHGPAVGRSAAPEHDDARRHEHREDGPEPADAAAQPEHDRARRRSRSSRSRPSPRARNDRSPEPTRMPSSTNAGPPNGWLIATHTSRKLASETTAGSSLKMWGSVLCSARTSSPAEQPTPVPQRNVRRAASCAFIAEPAPRACPTRVCEATSSESRESASSVQICMAMCCAASSISPSRAVAAVRTKNAPRSESVRRKSSQPSLPAARIACRSGRRPAP